MVKDATTTMLPPVKDLNLMNNEPNMHSNSEPESKWRVTYFYNYFVVDVPNVRLLSTRDTYAKIIQPGESILLIK